MRGRPADQRAVVLRLHRNVDTSGRVAIVCHDYHRGDRFTFDVFRRREPVDLDRP